MNLFVKEYIWPVFFLLAFVVALCFFYPVYQAVALIPALTAAIILIGNPRKYIFLYLFLLALFPLLQQIMPAGLGKHLDELIGGAITFLILMNIAFRRISERNSYSFVFGLLLVWAVLSLAFNRSSPLSFVRFFLTYMLFIPVFQLSKKYLFLKDLVVLLKGGIIIFWINVILNVGWFLGINPIYNEMASINNYVDMALGTFGGCNHVAYFCSMLAYFLITVLHYKVGSKRFRKVVLVTLLMTPIHMYFTYTNHAIVLFIITLIPLVLFTGMWKSWITMAALAGGGIIIIFLMAGETEVAKTLGRESLRDRTEALTDSAKVDIYRDLTINAIRDNPYEWAIGAGPGCGVGGLGRSTSSPMALRYLLKYYGATGADQNKAQLTSITGNASSGILSIWGDVGVVGTLLYFPLFLMMLFHAKRLFLKSKTPEVRAYSIALFSSMLFLLIMCILFDVLAMKFYSYSLWAIFGVLCRDDSKMMNRKQNLIPEEQGAISK